MKGLNNMNNSSNTKVKALKWTIVGVLLIGIPFVLDYLVDVCDWDKNNLLIIAANNIFPALGTICLLSFAWEIWNKRSFAKEVLELADVSENYIKSGIKAVYSDFSDINWNELFKGAKNVTCFFSYGYSWRRYNLTAIEKLRMQNTKVTIILPDYEDEEIMNSLNRDFAYEQYAPSDKEDSLKDVRDYIRDAEEYFKDQGATVKFFKGNIKSSYYLIDNTCVFVPFKHGKEKRSVPAFLCEKDDKNGMLFKFCQDDINAILNECRL